MSDETKCQKHIYSQGGWDRFTCGKPVKAEGLCGPHLAGKRRSEANDQARISKSTASANARVAAENALAEFGIKGAPEYDRTDGYYTGRVIVTVDELRRICGATS